MTSSPSKKQLRILDEITSLEKKRRIDVITCAIAFVIIVTVVLGKQYLINQGLIEPGNIVYGAITMIVAISLALVGGKASIDFTQSGHRLREIRPKK